MALWNALNALGVEISLNDVCCYIPAWFGVLATIFLAALTYECTNNHNAAVGAAGIMAIVPAHIMRSVGGGYDNESVAMTALCCTFYFWCRSLRNDNSWPVGIIAGLAYINMAAAWGGYVFVINMIGLHAIGLVFLGRYSNKLHHAYTLFYIIGTAGAVQVPVIGWTPLKSLEQLGAFGVFCILQALFYCDVVSKREGLDAAGIQALRMRVAGIAGSVGFLLVAIIWPTGYFGPLSSRIRGLFVQHTRTGNPLVDSVAEHQPASAAAYYQYLHSVCYIGPIGFVACLFKPTDAKWFLIMYACVAYYFSAKMVRLVLLLGPIGSALGGLALANGVEWMLDQLADVIPGLSDGEFEPEPEPTSPPKSNRSSKRGGRGGNDGGFGSLWKELCTNCRSSYDTASGVSARKIVAGLLALTYLVSGTEFAAYSQEMAIGMSQPSIMFKASLRNGQTIMVDDYREAYWWLRDNTPEDSRVMAWWDYGYQIAGIANRTTIADGNTWNHEHIATLGRCLTSPEKQAHRIVRHLADYVLVWTGGGGDDLAKSPHMARIGTSVYKDICPGDPTCQAFGFTDHTTMAPTPMMAESLLYKLHGHGQSPGVAVDPQRFREVFTSKYNKVRIYKVLKVSKKSKEWVANPANRDCDAPGSWYCTGNYPPALHELINQRKNFKQLEDFNVDEDEDDKEHYEEYMRRMAGGDGEVKAGYEEVKKADEEKTMKRRVHTPLASVCRCVSSFGCGSHCPCLFVKKQERKMAERAAKEAKAAGIAESLPADPEEEQVDSLRTCAMPFPVA